MGRREGKQVERGGGRRRGVGREGGREKEGMCACCKSIETQSGSQAPILDAV